MTTLLCHACKAMKQTYWHGFDREKSRRVLCPIGWLEYAAFFDGRKRKFVFVCKVKDDEEFRSPLGGFDPSTFGRDWAGLIRRSVQNK